MSGGTFSDDDLVEQVYLAVQPEGGKSETVNVWVVNESDHDLSYVVRTGEFASLDDSAIESAVAKRSATQLLARSALLFERDTIYGLDFMVWWEVDVKDNAGTLHRPSAIRGKYGWMNESRYVDIPFTGKRGVVLRLRARPHGNVAETAR